jgi:putative ABC transport system ATP-binding protein
MTNSISRIVIRDLVFRYPNTAAPCLDIASFEANAGDRVFLYGPSGSGKSTLLGLLGGVLAAEKGSIEILGQNFSALMQSQRDRIRADHIGFIFQQFNLIPYLSVIDNVLLPCRFSPRRLAQTLSDDISPTLAAERLLGQLDLDATLWKKQVTQLSVGQQQRVAAARALIGKPEMVIADEPTSAPDRQAAFLDLLLRECNNANALLLFVSHDRRLATAFNREIDLTSINRAVTEDFVA